MPEARDTKHSIVEALAGFGSKPLSVAATMLLESLGYKSERRYPLTPNTADNFVATFGQSKPVNEAQALMADWQTVDFLFQLTDTEVRAAAGGNADFQFEGRGRWKGAEINSFLFVAVGLAKTQYNRTQLSAITRTVNRLFNMPVILLFRHGDTLTMAIIPHRLHKRDVSKDVLEKVTLIKDIRFANPHRAHIEILFDLSFRELHENHGFSNFVELQAAWQKTLDSSELNKRFFLEVANWYFWTLRHAAFPKDAPKQNGKDHISVIRLITRLMFCWFIKEKGLIPGILFDESKLPQILAGFAPLNTRDNASVFYKAILQNLFFATLGTEMDKRAWAQGRQHFMAHSLYRYGELFQKADASLDLFKNIPFLNGGLFECLDRDHGENAKPRYERVDGFSRRPDSQAIVPDFLFFGPEIDLDLSEEYGDNRFRHVKVRGLIHTFNRYKFTISENTPIEEEIALDPELSGKVFENLLAAYNPETGATARKQTGSFYTPREIVSYMADEALIARLNYSLVGAYPSAKDVEARLRQLFTYNDETHKFNPDEVDTLIADIDNLRTFDPAVGSGAFPMGILHKLVFILGKLDPQNEKWKEHQRQRAIRETTEVFKIGDKLERQHRLDDINEVFEQNASDYGRKLYLIENCIYGVDIQPIAVQIAKMRFFISLVADQKVVNDAPNRGVRPLPNLETKFVAANTLIGISRPGQQVLRDREIETKEAELRSVRQRHFVARSLATKRKFRELDARLRGEIANLLKDDGWDPGTARDLAAWDPYDQSTSAPFFDPEWMFGIADGFDVIVANPPYIDSENMTITNPTLRGLIQSSYSMTRGNWDIYIAFYEKAFGLLDNHGVIAFITPDKWISKPFGDEMRLRTNDRIFSILRAGRDVFESSNVDAIVTLHTNSTCSDLRIYDVMDAEIALRRVIVKDALDAPYRYDWLFSDSFDLLAKIETQLTVLSQMATCENACATSDAYKLQEFIQEESRDTDNTEYLKIINTGTIGKFVSKWGQREMVYLRHRYLRPVVDRSRFLRAFPNSYGKKSIKPKLIVKGLNLLDICLDAEGNNIPGKTTLIVTADDLTTLKLLLGVLNSKLTFFYLREKYPASSYNEGTTFTKQMLNDLPLPQFADAASRKVISFVEQIVAAKTENPVADTTALEREINSLVYGSYGLTPEEIKIVEEVTGA